MKHETFRWHMLSVRHQHSILQIRIIPNKALCNSLSIQPQTLTSQQPIVVNIVKQYAIKLEYMLTPSPLPKKKRKILFLIPTLITSPKRSTHSSGSPTLHFITSANASSIVQPAVAPLCNYKVQHTIQCKLQGHPPPHIADRMETYSPT